MAQTNATAPTSSVTDLQAAAEKSKARNVNKALDKDAFLKLLVTQLRYQDPTKPMDDTSFIAEMAQFSSLEQMQNMNKTMEANSNFATLAQASGFIGKQVKIQPPGDDVPPVLGVVDEVRQAAGKVTVLVNGKEYNVTDIAQVMEKPPATDAGA